MRRHNESWIAKAVLIKMLGFAIMSFVIMLLWNNVVVNIFELRAISYFQSLGLLLFTRILTGNFGSRGHWGPGGMMYRKKMMYDRWKQMSEEERKDMMQRMKKRACSVDFDEKKE